MPSNKCKFVEHWLDRSRHPDWGWLQRSKKDETKAYCILCKTYFDISNMGVAAISSHGKGKKHRDAERDAGEPSNSGQQRLPWSCHRSETVLTSTMPIKNVSCTVTSGEGASQCSAAGSSDAAITMSAEEVSVPSAQRLTSEVNEVTDVISTVDVMPGTGNSKSVNRSCMSNYLNRDDVTKAEIIWAMDGIMNHSSLRGRANSASLFPIMFPDSDIARRMKIQKDKTAYVITYGLSPYFQELLSSTVQNCPNFTISFDESLNKVSQRGQMDIVVRFWNDETNRVSTRYLTSAFLGHSTSVDLLNAFTTSVAGQNLNMKKMLQVSMDGPNVNLAFLRELKGYLKNIGDPDDPELLEMGTCSLHVVHGSYKTAHNACGWKVHIFLRSLYYLFKDFPSRRNDYSVASNSKLFPLRFCGIRWVENSMVIKRAIEILPSLRLYISAVDKKPPASQNYKTIKNALTEKELAAKLGFLQSVAIQLEPFLTKYQSNKPLLPFMYSDLYALIRQLMSRFVKTDVMASVTNAAKLMAVDVKKKENHMSYHNIDIGFAAVSACRHLSGVEVLRFKEECCTYFISLRVC